MFLTKASKDLVAATIIILGFAAIFGLSNFLEKTFPPLPEDYADEDLALQGAKLKGYTLGFDGLIADWYWMQSLQYIGEKIVKSQDAQSLEKLERLNPRLLYPYLDNATTFDPNFAAVYSYGAVVLPDINPEQAVKIAQKGIDNNPEQWRLYQHLGYIYWRLGNYEKASETYEKGSNVEGAAPFMKLMAAKMKTDGGSRETSRSIYLQMLGDESADPRTKETAALRLQYLDSLDERDAARAVLENFREKNNRCANDWREILPLLKQIKLPFDKNFRVDAAYNLIDPSGAPYVLDKENCDVKLDLKTTKIPSS
jgi:predicted Zn-dependent protease